MFLLLFALLLALTEGAMGQESAEAIVQRSVEALQHDFQASPSFDYLERDRVRNGTKTYEDTMILGNWRECFSKYSSLRQWS